MNIEIADRLVALRREHGYSPEGVGTPPGGGRPAARQGGGGGGAPRTDQPIAPARGRSSSPGEPRLRAPPAGGGGGARGKKF